MTPTMNEPPRKFSPEELDRIRDGGPIIGDVAQHYAQMSRDPEYAEACRDRLLGLSILAIRQRGAEERRTARAEIPTQVVYLQPIVVYVSANGALSLNGNPVPLKCAVSGGTIRFQVSVPQLRAHRF
jgi:hypothetical protein